MMREVASKSADAAGDGTTTRPCWPRPSSRLKGVAAA